MDRKKWNDRLHALIEDSLLNPDAAPSLRDDTAQTPRIQELPLSQLVPNPLQPRRRFEDIEELADSIRTQGILYPLLVRPKSDGGYEIIAGERRYRAAILAGVTVVPVIVQDVSEDEARALALVENLQRQDLNPYEETLAIVDLLACLFETDRQRVVRCLYALHRQWRRSRAHNVMGAMASHEIRSNAFSLEDLETVFNRLGRFTWQSFVQNRLPLLSLPDDLKNALEKGEIPYTAALALRRIEEPQRGELLEAVKKGLSVRDLNREIRRMKQAAAVATPYRQVIGKLRRWEVPHEHEAEVRQLLDRLMALLDA